MISSNIVDQTRLDEKIIQGNNHVLGIIPGKKSGKLRKINKMVTCSINIAEELYSLLVNKPYETDVQAIDADTQPNPEELKKVRKLLDKAYKLDTSNFQTRHGNCIPNGMFELFGEYSGRDAQTRDELYDWLQDKSNNVQSVVMKAMLPFPH